MFSYCEESGKRTGPWIGRDGTRYAKNRNFQGTKQKIYKARWMIESV